MALNKYSAQTPPAQNQRKFLADEFRRVELSIASIIQILENVGIKVEIGPADSGGVGYRVLRIPN